jgi:hypothetical protein
MENSRAVRWWAVGVDALLVEGLHQVTAGLELLDQLDEAAGHLVEVPSSGARATTSTSGPVGLPGAGLWPGGRLSDQLREPLLVFRVVLRLPPRSAGQVAEDLCGLGGDKRIGQQPLDVRHPVAAALAAPESLRFVDKQLRRPPQLEVVGVEGRWHGRQDNGDYPVAPGRARKGSSTSQQPGGAEILLRR